MSVQYRMKAPLAIWAAYNGNPQAIARAMELGILKLEEGVTAVMEGKRASQLPQQMPQGTVAQQVMGGVPPVPAPPPVPAAGGLGATPQAAPPMAPPEMGMAPPMPQEAPMGMAEGGLAMLSVPDAMFDEPTNGGFDDGYAGGGIVAFAKGGISDLYDDVEYWESGGKQGAISPKGARGVMQLMPGTMRDPGFGIRAMQADTEEENRRVGQEYLDAMFRRYGDKKVALAAYNWGPGNVDKWLKSGADPKKLPKETQNYISNIMGGKDNVSVPERDLGTAEGRAMAPLDIFEALQSRFGPTEKEKEIEAKLLARAEERASKEFYEKERMASVNDFFTEVGFNMASSDSPFLLQAVGQAAAAAAPGARASRKERQQLKDRALDVMQAMNDKSRKENRELLGVAIDMAKTGIDQEQFEAKMAFSERELKAREDQAALDRNMQLDLAKLRVNPSDMETAVKILQTGTEAEKAALKQWIELKKTTGEAGALDALPPGPGGALAPNAYAGFSAEQVG
jgi:hypothetical protein